MRASPTTGVLRFKRASLFCAVAVKHAFSTVSSADFMFSAGAHPGLRGCGGGSPRAWQHSGKGHGLLLQLLPYLLWRQSYVRK